MRQFLTCGLAERGFARAWCSTCRTSYLIPYSCRGRSFCPSCEKKRALLWAEWLLEEVLEGVPHRHIVMTIPRLLRPLFRRRRELLRDLARCAAAALAAHVEKSLGEAVRPGIVVSIATAGDLAQWHPHLHILATDGDSGSDICTNDQATGVPSATLEECLRTGVSASQYGNLPGTSTNFMSALWGGNPDLKVETADTLTVGLVWTPEAITGLSATIDYYDIRLEDTIDWLSARDIVR